MRLSDSHQQQLKESAIAEEVAVARGYRTIRHRSEVPDDFANWQRRLGLLVPTHSPDRVTCGHQLRPNKPIHRKNGNAPRYETPAGSRITLDVNPLMLEEVRHGVGDLWLTEGCKKVDSLTSRSLPTVGIIGVWNFAEPGSKGKTPLPCWDHVQLRGRRVIIVYDADARTNANVQEALRRLVAMLEKLGAVVLVVYLPEVNGDGKAGVDDYLAAGGTVAELRLMAAPYQLLDVGAERMSRDEKLRAGLEDLGRRFWYVQWQGMGGASARDVYLKLIEAARRHGKVVEDGIRVVKAQGPVIAALRMPRFRSSPEMVAGPISRSASTKRRSGRKMSNVWVMVGSCRKASQSSHRGDLSGLTRRSPRCRAWITWMSLLSSVMSRARQLARKLASLLDAGMTTWPIAIRKASETAEAVTPCFSPMFRSTGSDATAPRHSGW